MSAPLRVLTIGHSYVVALNQRVPAAIANDSRIDLTLAAPRFHYGDLRRLHLEKASDPHYRIVPLTARWTRKNHIFWYEHRALRRLIREGEFDVVHAWEEPYSYAGYEIARAVAPSGARFMFRTAQSIVKQYPWPFSHFERFTLARADGWVAGGGLVYEAMKDKGFPCAHGRVITLGVDMDVFRPLDRKSRRTVLDELRVDPPVVGFIGRLVEAKGLDILMAAMERVKPPWSLLILGSGPYESNITRWATARGWSDRVRILLVPHDDVPRYLGAMDLMLAPSQTTPSWKEQFGRMIIEAFACGVPVIGSDSGEIPYVIAEAGVVVPEADVGEWVRQTETLLSDERRRHALGGKGLQRCREHYDVGQVAEKYIEFYHELCGAGA